MKIAEVHGNGDLKPPVCEGWRTHQHLPRLQANSLAFRLLVDTWLMFGLELGVIGIMLMIASGRDLNKSVYLVQTVIALEVVNAHHRTMLAVANRALSPTPRGSTGIEPIPESS